GVDGGVGGGWGGWHQSTEGKAALCKTRPACVCHPLILQPQPGACVRVCVCVCVCVCESHVYGLRGGKNQRCHLDGKRMFKEESVTERHGERDRDGERKGHKEHNINN